MKAKSSIQPKLEIVDQLTEAIYKELCAHCRRMIPWSGFLEFEELLRRHNQGWEKVEGEGEVATVSILSMLRNEAKLIAEMAIHLTGTLSVSVINEYRLQGEFLEISTFNCKKVPVAGVFTETADLVCFEIDRVLYKETTSMILKSLSLLSDKEVDKKKELENVDHLHEEISGIRASRIAREMKVTERRIYLEINVIEWVNGDLDEDAGKFPRSPCRYSIPA